MLTLPLCSGAADLFPQGFNSLRTYLLLCKPILEASEFKGFNWAQRRIFSHCFWTRLLIMQADLFPKEHWVLPSVLNMEITSPTAYKQTSPKDDAGVSSMLVAGNVGVAVVTGGSKAMLNFISKLVVSQLKWTFGIYVHNLWNGNPVGFEAAHLPQPCGNVRFSVLSGHGSEASVWCKWFSLRYHGLVVLSFLEIPELNNSVHYLWEKSQLGG